MSRDETLDEHLVRHLRTIARLMDGEGGGARADWPYRSIEAFVLAHGRLWWPHWQQLPVAERGTDGACFANAGVRATRFPSRYVYVEGIAWRSSVPMPVAHAWLGVRDHGTAIETTWKLDPGEQVSYFGVPFYTAYLMATTAGNGVWGLLDRHERGWPLLSEDGATRKAVETWPSR